MIETTHLTKINTQNKKPRPSNKLGLIVLEGLDKAGKTSLANHLHKLLGWKIIKFSQPTRPPFEEYMEFLVNQDEPAILDRFYLGENAYGPVKRGKSQLTDLNNWTIELALQARNAITIYCEVPGSITKVNFIKEKETFINYEESQLIRKLYRKQVVNSTKLYWHVFNYLEDPKYKQITKYVKNQLKQVEKFDNWLVIRRVLGNPFSKVMILGEECNFKREKPEFQKLMVPFIKGSGSKYLKEALDLAGIHNYILSNAKKFHLFNSNDLKNFELKLPNLRKVICLGEVAHSMVRTQLPISSRIEVHPLAHPSYASRFNIPIEQYAQALKELYEV